VDSRVSLERELRQYRRVVELESSRQEEMRETILAQQEEVRRLTEQVAQFQVDLGEVDRLAQQIQEMMGLTTPTPTPTPTVAASSDDGSSVGGQSHVSAASSSTGSGRTTSSRGQTPRMGLVSENSQQIAAMQDSLPLRVGTLDDLISEAEMRLARIEPDRRTNAEQIEQEMKLLAAAPHSWPVDGEIDVTSVFGYRVLKGVREFHEGIDVAVWYGTPVQATKDGTVTRSGWLAGYGWVVEIEHEMGFSTLYAHNSRLLVKRGDEVKAGDVIAKSGSTGNSTGPHVHYEIQLYGTPVDPLKYIGLDAGE
jgi:murein DD-endopeptidase MepM/ murein hydrolase activator NlpD